MAIGVLRESLLLLSINLHVFKNHQDLDYIFNNFDKYLTATFRHIGTFSSNSPEMSSYSLQVYKYVWELQFELRYLS